MKHNRSAGVAKGIRRRIDVDDTISASGLKANMRVGR
jgi:hypothetical protein